MENQGEIKEFHSRKNQGIFLSFMIEECEYLWLRNVSIYDWGMWVFMIEECEYLWLRNVSIYDWGMWVFMIEECEYLWLRNVSIYDWGMWVFMAASLWL